MASQRLGVNRLITQNTRDKIGRGLLRSQGGRDEPVTQGRASPSWMRNARRLAGLARSALRGLARRSLLIAKKARRARRCCTPRRWKWRSATAGSTARSSATTKWLAAEVHSARRQERVVELNRERAEALITSGGCTRQVSPKWSAPRRTGAGRTLTTRRARRSCPAICRPRGGHPEAKSFFATLNSANRYAIVWRLETAKKAETRARRLRQFIEMLERHEKLHP